MTRSTGVSASRNESKFLNLANFTLKDSSSFKILPPTNSKPLNLAVFPAILLVHRLLFYIRSSIKAYLRR